MKPPVRPRAALTAGRTMSFFLGRKVLLGFILAWLLVGGVGLISYQSLNQFVEASRAKSQTLEIFRRLDNLEMQLSLAERWQQLYCRDGEPNQLGAFQEKVELAGYASQALRNVAADSRQQLSLTGLEPLITRRLELLQALINRKKSGTLDAAAQEKYANEGKDVEGEIRERITDMRRMEYRLQQDREDYSRTSAETATLVIFLGYLLAFLLVGVATLLIDREMTVRKRAQEDLRRALDDLEVRIQERTAELATANAALRAEQERLQILSRQLLYAQETERRRIARELHDEIGQVLTAVKINLQTLQRTAAPAGHGSLQESIAIVDRAVQQVRNLSLDLRPSLLDDLGLVAALRWYVDRQSARAGYHGQVVADPPDLTVPPEVATTCFRVAQEALTNVVRHAHAQRVRVELRREDGELRLVVRDDGKGFEVAAANRRAARGASLGLLGMQERVQLVGGRLELKSAPGSGTEVCVHLPLTPPAVPAVLEGSLSA
jgi:signal transduction histidine kinase